MLVIQQLQVLKMLTNSAKDALTPDASDKVADAADNVKDAANDKIDQASDSIEDAGDDVDA